MEPDNPQPDLCAVKPRPGPAKPARHQHYAWALLGWLSAISLAAILLLRCYAMLFTVPVRAWDDSYYRNSALDAAAQCSRLHALAGVVLPNSGNLLGTRTVGYESWLVLFLKCLPGLKSERVFQAANVFMFLLQGALWYALVRRVTGRRAFALCTVYIYLSCPLVFGINRWVITENHVTCAATVFVFMAYWLLQPPRDTPRGRWGWLGREVALPLLAGWAVGCFSTLREYALANLAVGVGCILLGLAWRRRWSALAAFSLALAPYLAALAHALPPILKAAGTKSTSTDYYHPFSEMIPFALQNAFGPALAVFLAGGLLITIPRMFRKALFTGKDNENAPLAILWLGLFVLTAFTLWLNVHSVNRSQRYYLPLIVAMLGLIFTGMQLIGNAPNRRNDRPGLAVFLLPYLLGLLVLATWPVSIYQLFIAFDGGKSYAVHPTELTHWNYPLHLRPLTAPNDYHIVRIKK